MSLEGKVALVTGATRGIGKAIAHELARLGAEVVGTATSAEGAESITQGLKAAGFKGYGIVMNVAEAESIDAGLKQITEQTGAPLILVNNAGITRDNLLMRLKDDDWTSVLETNLSSVYRTSKRSEEHTSELQSRPHLVCRLLLEKKKKSKNNQK